MNAYGIELDLDSEESDENIVLLQEIRAMVRKLGKRVDRIDVNVRRQQGNHAVLQHDIQDLARKLPR